MQGIESRILKEPLCKSTRCDYGKLFKIPWNVHFTNQTALHEKHMGKQRVIKNKRMEAGVAYVVEYLGYIMMNLRI